MQLHPFFATVSRPVYHDRAGFLFLAVECPECKGEGVLDFDDGVDGFSRPYSAPCACCNGEGQVYEQVAEDEL
jgi:DnaJ-class molecular chaperone